MRAMVFLLLAGVVAWSRSGAAAPSSSLYAFVGSGDGKVRVFRVDPKSGAWTKTSEVAAGTNPSFLAFDPPRRRVFATDEVAAGKVRSFSFDPEAGALVETSVRSSRGSGTTHVSLDPTGRWLLAASYTSGTMAVLPVKGDGTLGEAVDTRASGEKSHWAGTDPSGARVYVPALGANVVAHYALDPATGKLADRGRVALPPGAGPRHLAFHPTAPFAWVVNELATTVTTFRVDPATGKLTPTATIDALPAGQSRADTTGAGIVVHPSGKVVYVSTRGFDAVVRFTVDADGKLVREGHVLTGAKRPRAFAIDPEGTLLYAGNEDAGHVVGFRIDPATGKLAPLGTRIEVPEPTFVGLARFP